MEGGAPKLTEEEIAKIQEQNYSDQRSAVTLNNKDRFANKGNGLEKSSSQSDIDVDK